MATKQFGRLKVHWSKRGIAYKWGDGGIHRLSFERNKDGQEGQPPMDGYEPGSPDESEYGAYDRGYEQGQPYPPQGEGYPPQRDYASDGYYPEEGAPAGRAGEDVGSSVSGIT
jgi:hypothetical protein